MTPWNSVLVFISSTFLDMHAERDLLVKRVFPFLSLWCEKRRIKLTEVDLRWGIREEDSQENNRVVNVCLENIDRCRPLFLCFYGQRRGWVPTLSDVPDPVLRAFPGLADNLREGRSITELEIIHAISGGKDCDPFFFFRDPSFLDSIDDAAVKREIYAGSEEDEEKQRSFRDYIKARVRGDSIFSYTARWDRSLCTPELRAKAHPGVSPQRLCRGRLTDFMVGERRLEDVVTDVLKAAILRLFPDRAEPVTSGSRYEREADAQERFVMSRAFEYVPGGGAEDILFNDYIGREDSACPFVIAAPYGTGKSAFLAEMVRCLRERSDCTVIYRFIGVNGGCIEHGLVTSLIHELTEKGLIDKKMLLSDENANFVSFPTLLKNAASAAGKLILVLDGLDQLGLPVNMLDIPFERIDSTLKIVLSFSTESTGAPELITRMQMRDIPVIGLVNDKPRLRIMAESYLSRYLKALSPNMLDEIVSNCPDFNPLFEKIVLSELRVFGSHDELSEEINKYKGKSVVESFGQMISRMENDITYSLPALGSSVPIFLGLLACSINGLSLRELCDTAMVELKSDKEYPMSLIEDAASVLLAGVRDFVALDGERYMIRYESLSKAISVKYGSGMLKHKLALAFYFLCRYKAILGSTDSGDPEERKLVLSELPDYLWRSLQLDGLDMLLRSYEFIRAKVKYCGIYETLSDFSHTNDPDALEIKRILLTIAADIPAEGQFDEALFAGQLIGRLDSRKYGKLRASMKKAVNVKWSSPSGKAFLSAGIVWSRVLPQDCAVCCISCLDERVNILCQSTSGFEFFQLNIKTGEIRSRLVGDQAQKTQLKKWKEVKHPEVIRTGYVKQIKRQGDHVSCRGKSMMSLYDNLLGYYARPDLCCACNGDNYFILRDGVLHIYKRTGALAERRKVADGAAEIFASSDGVALLHENSLLELYKISFGSVSGVHTKLFGKDHRIRGVLDHCFILFSTDEKRLVYIDIDGNEVEKRPAFLETHVFSGSVLFSDVYAVEKKGHLTTVYELETGRELLTTDAVSNADMISLTADGHLVAAVGMRIIASDISGESIYDPPSRSLPVYDICISKRGLFAVDNHDIYNVRALPDGSRLDDGVAVSHIKNDGELDRLLRLADVRAAQPFGDDGTFLALTDELTAFCIDGSEVTRKTTLHVTDHSVSHFAVLGSCVAVVSKEHVHIFDLAAFKNYYRDQLIYEPDSKYIVKIPIGFRPKHVVGNGQDFVLFVSHDGEYKLLFSQRTGKGTSVKMSGTGTFGRLAFVSASGDIVASVNSSDDKLKLFRAADGKLSKISEITLTLRNKEVPVACVCGTLRNSDDILVLCASCTTGSTRVIRVFSDGSGEASVFHSDRQFSTMEAFGAHTGKVFLRGADRLGAVISV